MLSILANPRSLGMKAFDYPTLLITRAQYSFHRTAIKYLYFSINVLVDLRIDETIFAVHNEVIGSANDLHPAENIRR